MSDKLLKIENLSVNYETKENTFEAVSGLNLELKKGKVLGLVGETGAGKTTTALSILKLLPERTGRVRSGEIVFEGSNILELSESEMREIRGNKISMIFQDPMTSLNPVKTVGYQISEVYKTHTKLSDSEIEKKTEEMLNLVGIPPKRKKEYPHQFSGGMKQRVVIAMALACEPDLLIADEPTTALDVTIQAQVLKMISDLRKQYDMSMILITHDLGVVAQNCDYVAVMYAGEVIQYGDVYKVYENKERHPYTDGLFKTIPDLDVDEDRLRPIEGLMPDPANLPTGCRFHDRCKKCMEICKTVHPEEHIVNGQMIKCHLFKNF